jgi:type IV fimbrial biogenesis protein FimT
VSGQREELIASINLARAEAIRRGQPVVIRRITGCAVVLAANNDWSCGWNVFADLNANNALDASDVVIQEVSVALRTRVTKPGAVSQEFLTVNQYSRITQGAQRFEVIPDGGVAASGQAICISSGARIRSVEGTTACT